MVQRRSRFRSVTLAVATILFLSSPPCQGWEEDVHYGLTYWLARQAGFQPRYAETIAKGAQAYDRGSFLTAIAGVAHIMVTGEKETSRLVQKNHFPSRIAPPAPATDRRVDANAGIARTVFRFTRREGLTRDEWLQAIGENLHPFQDSWSHRGVPDIPFTPGPALRPDFSWGHPCDRGGWSAHDADLTYLDVESVDKMAEQMWMLFQQVLAGDEALRERRSEAWSTVQANVRKFAEARTQADKRRWFNSSADFKLSDFGNPNFLQGTSLREEGVEPNVGPYRTSCGLVHSPSLLTRIKNVLLPLPSYPVIVDSAPARRTVDAFLEAALIRRNMAATFELFAQFRSDARTGELAREKRIRMIVAVRSLQVRDHGEANAARHGSYPLPKAVNPDLMSENSLIGLPFYDYGTIEEALQPASGFVKETKSPFYLLMGSDTSLPFALRRGILRQDAAIAVFQLKRLPRDVIFLSMRHSSVGWRITDLNVVAL